MTFSNLERKGWILKCPFCAKDIAYTLFTNQDAPTPFFYADTSNDILLRKSDQNLVHELYERGEPSVEQLAALWNDIVSNAPASPDGGKFHLWSNVKCVTCGREIPYNNGIEDIKTRIFEPKIVVVDGSRIIGDAPSDTWRVNVKV